MTGDPRIVGYDWVRGRETMLRFGPDHGPVVILALPLFEEANRTRALGIGILRELALRGIGGAVPELPGQGESLVATAAVTLRDLQAAYGSALAVAADGASDCYGVAIRSGALIDRRAALAGRWHLAPQSGPELLRELRRMLQATTPRRLPDDCWWRGAPAGTAPPPIEIAGNMTGADLLDDLHGGADAGPTTARRIVRLASDPRYADQTFDAPPPWRRAQPDGEVALAQELADDIANWIAKCAT